MAAVVVVVGTSVVVLMVVAESISLAAVVVDAGDASSGAALAATASTSRSTVGGGFDDSFAADSGPIVVPSSGCRTLAPPTDVADGGVVAVETDVVGNIVDSSAEFRTLMAAAVVAGVSSKGAVEVHG